MQKHNECMSLMNVKCKRPSALYRKENVGQSNLSQISQNGHHEFAKK